MKLLEDRDIKNNRSSVDDLNTNQVMNLYMNGNISINIMQGNNNSSFNLSQTTALNSNNNSTSTLINNHTQNSLTRSNRIANRHLNRDNIHASLLDKIKQLNVPNSLKNERKPFDLLNVIKQLSNKKHKNTNEMRN